MNELEKVWREHIAEIFNGWSKHSKLNIKTLLVTVFWAGEREGIAKKKVKENEKEKSI